jgi:hypothetical protein
MNYPNTRKRGESAGFVLVITVVILALLTIMAIAFLSSSTSERAISRATANKAKSDLAAKTAFEVAVTRLIDNFSQFPDSATTWESVNGVNSGTVLYFRDKTPKAAAAAGVPAQLNVLPLISGATAQPVATKASALTTLDNTNSFDLNHARFSGDTQGWIGAPPGAATRPEFRGQWLNLTNSDGKVTGRYAFWMEDESFKVNANLMGKALRGSSTLGDSPTQIPWQGILPIVFPTPNPPLGYYDPIAQDVFDFRSKFRSSLFLDYRGLNQVTKNVSAADFSSLAEVGKFETTIFSGGMNLSRSGSKRVNLNEVVADSTDATTIRKQLDEIIKTITYNLPNFGQRFYRSGSDLNSLDVPDTATSPHRTIYLNKIAANIRDYIDTDSQPTIINNDGDPTINPPTPFTVKIGSAPTNAIRAAGGGTSGSNEVIAIGKERVPAVQEYVLRVRQLAFSPRTGTFANYTISIDHYLEFWNNSNRDISLANLGGNPFLLIANQPGWDANTLDSIPEGATRDLKLSLNTAKNAVDNSPLTVFPAGAVVVITTDLTPLNTLTPDKSRVYIVPIPPPKPNPMTYSGSGTTELRTYSGKTDKKSSSQLRLNLLTRTTSTSDYETEIALGNDLGILESAWGAGALTSAMSINIDTKTPAEDRFDHTKWHFEGASLKGNMGAAKPNATTGDPRTNAEQIRFDLNSGVTNSDKTRYSDSGLDSKNIPGNSTLGTPNSNYVNPSAWIDYSSSTPTANTAPAVFANVALTSIGQLGDIFDPVRGIGDATGSTSGTANNILLSRSGGRTLKIGQPERFDSTANPAGLWDGDSNSASREWTAWRLTDIFTTSDSVPLDGRININSVQRDGGTALKAAIYGYTFQSTPDSDPNLAGKPFDADPPSASDKVNELIKQMQARATNDQTAYSAAFKNTSGPFTERGELSEMPMFNTGTDLATGVDTANVYDRGREELFRRMAELITTRGNIFTVYAVGQSLIPQSSGTPIVTSTSQLKVTFRIDPMWNAGMPTDPWDPNDSAATANRFKKPDKYAIKILCAGD